MRSVIFLVVYGVLYFHFQLWRLTDSFVQPPLFYGVVAGFVLFDLLEMGFIRSYE